jgi:Doubled CXXCH motif (Paired_CXXCH_1)
MTHITRSFAVLAAIGFATMAFAQTTGIRNSAHDLSNSSGTAALKSQAANHNQICIICHTPHHAQSTQLLWNHTPTLTASFTWGNDMDGAGTNLPTTLRSASKRCLGCHDGTVAVGDMSNSGGGFAGVMTGFANVAGQTDADGKLVNAAYLVGGGGSMGGNHPISIPYAGETAYNSIDSSVPAADVGPAVLGGYYSVVTGAACTSASGICTAAPASDGRNGAAVNLIPNLTGATTNAGIECTSCHEPHNRYGFHAFSRVDVENASGLCRSCHNK